MEGHAEALVTGTCFHVMFAHTPKPVLDGVQPGKPLDFLAEDRGVCRNPPIEFLFWVWYVDVILSIVLVLTIRTPKTVRVNVGAKVIGVAARYQEHWNSPSVEAFEVSYTIAASGVGFKLCKESRTKVFKTIQNSAFAHLPTMTVRTGNLGLGTDTGSCKRRGELGYSTPKARTLYT